MLFCELELSLLGERRQVERFDFIWTDGVERITDIQDSLDVVVAVIPVGTRLLCCIGGKVRNFFAQVETVFQIE